MSKKNKKIVEEKHSLPMLQMRGSVSPSSLDEESRTVEIVWSTGHKGKRSSIFGSYFEELEMSEDAVDMSRLTNGAPLLSAHNAYDLRGVIGVVEDAWLDGKKGRAKVRFSSREDVQPIFQDIKDGILRNISVGYSVDEYRDVSGKDDEIPTLRAVRWQPAELSVVPIGFDPKAQVRSEGENESTVIIKREIETSDSDAVETETRSDESSVNPNSSIGENDMLNYRNKHLKLDRAEDGKDGAGLGGCSEAPKVEQPTVDKDAIKREAQASERARVAEITQLVRKAKLEDELADKFISDGVEVEEARKQILEKVFEAQEAKPQIKSQVRVEVGKEDHEKKRDGMVSAILSRVDRSNFEREQGNPYNGLSLLRMFEDLAGNRNGITDAQFATRVMSSSDLPYILANVAEKSAQKKYDLQPRTWSRWAKTDTLRNYKTHDRVRSGDFASLEERKENGEFKYGSFGEEREQVELKDYGKIMAFTRIMLINDDLSEISKVTSQAGVAASRLENNLVYSQLTSNPTMGDGTTLFHADHSNLGTASALTDTEIGEAFKLMRQQTSVDGLDKLNLSPRYLICGPENEVTARKYLATISPTQASNVNVFSNSLELIVDSEIDNDDYFFAADQNLIDTVVLFHLEGQERPRVESRTKFETEAVELKVAHSAVAKAMDWRGLVKNAGAS